VTTLFHVFANIILYYFNLIIKNIYELHHFKCNTFLNFYSNSND
jgi:hypothetical protein